MDDRAAVLRGAVLRAWREDTGMSVRELARRLPASPGAVSMWESGQRGAKTNFSSTANGGRDVKPQLTVELFADRLRFAESERRAMLDMWSSVGSVTAVGRRTSWSHNFQEPSQAAWAWVRSSEGTAGLVSGTARWGEPFQAQLSVQGRTRRSDHPGSGDDPEPALADRARAPWWVGGLRRREGAGGRR